MTEPRKPRDRPTFFVKVKIDGFLVADQHLLPAIEGHIVGSTAVRKLFLGGELRCYSPDTIRSTDGVRCAACQHPKCQFRTRLRLENGAAVFLLDLAYTSTRNLIRLYIDDALADPDNPTCDGPVRLTTVDRETWAEVRFERL